MSGRLLSVILILIYFISPNQGNGQPPSYNHVKSHKLGLVLSGGGAKGIAHVGILKALEQEGIRPDFITGTSMGSIIGGLYAIGYSADQLDTIVRSINWDLVLSNNIPLNFISYEEKEYYNRYLLEFPVENWKMKLPTGLIEGQTLSEVLNHYTWPAYKYKTFDEFPIPFRCIATDVSTGKPIVFKDGSLSKAIRSSMAIPSAFTAVDLDSTLAVDGGVVNNFPVEELFAMGADVVIGVDVGDGLIPAKKLEGMADILFQVSMYKSLERLQDQIPLCDIYIKPDLKNYGTASFSNYSEILALGYAAGELHRTEFRELKEKYKLKERKFKPISFAQEPISFESITLSGNKWSSDNLINSKLGLRENQQYARRDIENGVRRVFGTNIFKKVTHNVVKGKKPDQYHLRIELDEKPRITLKTGLHHDNTFLTGITLNLTLRDYLLKSSRFIIAGDISKNPKFRFDYLQYIGKMQSKAFNFKYNYLNEQIPSYEEGQLIDVDMIKEHSLSAGFLTTQRLESSHYIGLKYLMSNMKVKYSSVIPEEIKNGRFTNFRLETAYFSNTLNDRNYATSGREIMLLAQLFLANSYRINFVNGVDSISGFTEDEFNELLIKPLIPGIYGLFQFNYYKFFPLRAKNQLIPSFAAGFTLAGDDFALIDGYRIGGFQQVKLTDAKFLGLNFAEMNYENYLMTGLHFQQNIMKSFFLNLGTEFLLPYDYISLKNLDTFDFGKAFNDYSMVGYGAKLTYKSFIGPISIGISRNTRDSFLRYYFALGFSFNYSD